MLISCSLTTSFRQAQALLRARRPAATPALSLSLASAVATAAATVSAAVVLSQQYDPVAFAQRRRAGRDHPHAFRHARRDFDLAGVRHAEYHRLEFRDIAITGHVHALLAGRIDDRVGRHHEDLRAVLDRKADLRIH